MDFFPQTFLAAIPQSFSFILYLILCLNIFSLPANWLILGAIALWCFIWPLSPDLGLFQWILLILLAILGEVVENLLQIFTARKYGASSRAAFSSIIGAILGAILFSPFLWGLGAILGALLGAWLSSYFMERLTGKTPKEALKAAHGVTIGRLFGTAIKIGLGTLIIFLASHWLWPEESELPKSLPEQEEYVTNTKCCDNFM